MLSLIQKKYPGARVNTPLSIHDDREKNIVTYTVSFKIPIRTRYKKKTLNIRSFIVENYLATDIYNSRCAPFSLHYPHWVKEHIHVEGPDEKWPSCCNQMNYTFDTHTFSCISNIEANRADFDYELCHHKDHVPISQIQDYFDNINEISDISFELFLGD